MVDVGVVPPPPPPQLEVQPPDPTETGTLELALPPFGFVELGLSPTMAKFVIVVPAVPALAVAAIVRVAVELALMSPIVQVPVLEA